MCHRLLSDRDFFPPLVLFFTWPGHLLAWAVGGVSAITRYPRPPRARPHIFVHVKPIGLASDLTTWLGMCERNELGSLV